MKELKNKGDTPIINTHYPLKQGKPIKRWVIAMTNSNHQQKKTYNKCVEAAFMRIVDAVKELYITKGTTYFEQDSRRDRDSAMAMHTLLTPDFYIHLQCSFLYDYEVEFAFSDSNHESLIRQMLKIFPLNEAAKPYDLLPTFEEFYYSVIEKADAAHIHIL